MARKTTKKAQSSVAFMVDVFRFLMQVEKLKETPSCKDFIDARISVSSIGNIHIYIIYIIGKIFGSFFVPVCLQIWVYVIQEQINIAIYTTKTTLI